MQKVDFETNNYIEKKGGIDQWIGPLFIYDCPNDQLYRTRATI